MKVIGLDQSDIWDEIVKSFPNHDVYYLSGYARPHKVHGDGEPVLLYYDKDGGRGVCVLMIRDVASDPHLAGLVAPGQIFDASTPYGYGGFIYDGDVNAASVKAEFAATLRERNINSVFFRFHPVLNNAGRGSILSEVIPLGKTIAMDLSSPATIWNNLSSSCRGRIRKATKSGVTISHTDNPDMLFTFKDLYDKTMKAVSAEPYYFFKDEFYQCMASSLKGHYRIFYSTYQGKIISAAIMLHTNGQMHFHLGGSLREYHFLAPVNLTFYHAALWGHQQGLRTLHLGGGLGAHSDSLYRYKSTFNRNSNYQFSIGKTIIDREVYRKILLLRNMGHEDTATTEYFPKYRAK